MFIVFNSNLNNLLNLDSDKISQKLSSLQDTYVKEGFFYFLANYANSFSSAFSIIPLCEQRRFQMHVLWQ